MASIRVVDGFVFAIGALSVVSNVVNLLTLMMNHNCKQIFRKSMSYMVVCLAIADLLTGLNSVLWGLRDATGWYPINYMFTIYWTTVQVSFLTVLVMAVDRFIAVNWPTTSEDIVSPARTLIVCSFTWVLSLGIGLLIYYKIQVGKFVFCALFELDIIAVVVMYSLMYRKARDLSRLAHSGDRGQQEKKIKLRSETRLYTVVLLLAGILVVTVFPYVLALQIELAYKLRSPDGKPNQALSNFLDYYLPIELLNFLVNPIVYVWRLPKYRKALTKTFCCKS